MKFNINDYVTVKLKPLGVRLLKEQHEELYNFLYQKTNGRTTLQTPAEYNRVLDEQLAASDNHYRIQLWSLMDKFGSYCGLGLEAPFETTIELEE